MTPFLLIPGLVCTAEIFAPQIPVLWPHGPVQVANTLSGETMAEMARAILADAPPTFALIGFSMGGYISFEILRQARERVTSLALIDTSARPDTDDQTANRRASVARARDGDYAAVLDSLVPLLFHPDHRQDPALIAANRRMGLAVGVEGFARQQEAVISRPDSRPDLAAIRVPAVVIVGDRDTLTPPDRSLEMAKGIAGARLEIIPGCGHASTLERPDRVNQALEEWITQDWS